MKTTTRKCDFCHSEEGKPRIVGQYIVELKEVEFNNPKILACQSCYRKSRILKNKQYKKEIPMKTIWKKILNKIGLFIISGLIVLLITSITIYAQGTPGLPAFPDSPDAAPIDGGLSLLAAAGGAYAVKKLREKRSQE